MSFSDRPAGKPDSERRLRQNIRFARLLKLLLTLMNRNGVALVELAAVLECSERTVRRDLQVLELAGIPWVLEESTRTYRVLPGWKLSGLESPNGGKQTNDAESDNDEGYKR